MAASPRLRAPPETAQPDAWSLTAAMPRKGHSMAPQKRQRDQDIGIRRQRVAQLRLAGVVSCRAIAAVIGVSHDTVARDLRHLEQRWQAEADADIAAAKGMDLARIEDLILGAWKAATGGSLGAIREVRELIKLRASILGYSAPVRLTGADGASPIKVEHRHGIDPHASFGFTSEEAFALYELAERYEEEAGK
jgi:hypothetical protein